MKVMRHVGGGVAHVRSGGSVPFSVIGTHFMNDMLEWKLVFFTDDKEQLATYGLTGVLTSARTS